MAGNTLLIRINGSAKNFLDELDKINKRTKDTQKILKTTAKVASIAFLALAGTIAAVTRSYAKYETALVGVGKTTDIQGKKLKNFGKDIQNLSKRIPIATNELLAITQAAGQLGVTGEENLLKFTETVAKLGVATDLAGEEAAVALTRILTVTQEGVGNIDKFGSVIVALGNQFAATESEIVHMATEISRATAIFGVNAGEAAALSAALKSIGVQAELGGSSVGRSFRAISKAINEGGSSLKRLEQLTGLAGEELVQTFETDATRVFQLFLEGLNRLPIKDVTKELGNFGLKGRQILAVLPALAKRSDLVSDALRVQAEEYKNATALNEEARRAFATLASQAQLLVNDLTRLSVSMGEQFAGDARALINSVREIVNSLNDMDDEAKGNIATILKWGAIIAGAIAALSSLGLGLLVVVKSFVGLKIAILAAGKGILALTGPIGLAIAGAAALAIGLGKALSVSGDEVPDSLKETTLQLERARKALENNLRIQKELNKENDTEAIAGNKRLEQKIKLLEEQKKKLEETAILQRNLADKEFGTGELLLREKIIPGETPGFTPDLPGEQEIPLTFGTTSEGLRKEDFEKEIAAVQDKERQKEEIADEATQKRIDARKSENEALRDQEFLNAALESENLTAKQEALLTQEADFAAERRDLTAQRKEAEQIKNSEERELALETVRLKNNALLEQEKDFFAKKAEVNRRENERQRELDKELQELNKEERGNLNDEDLSALEEQLETEDEADRTFARRKAQRQLDVRKKAQQDTREHNVVIAKLNKFFNSSEVQGVKRTTSDLEQLRSSSSKKQQKIGKAAARVNAAIKTAEGAISAYTSLAPIPIVGPALGAAAAAVLLNFGLEQQRKIDAQPAGAQRGGIIQPALGGARDRVPALLEPGELITPAALVPDFLQAVGRPEVSTEGGGTPRVEIELTLSDNAFDIIEARRDEEIALGIREGT